MSAQRARNYFLGKSDQRLNCAQSIVAALQSSNKALLEECAEYGGGRAPEGWCGPAYVASILNVEKRLIEEEYNKHAGSVKCQEIRKNGRLSCENCVKLGAELIERSTNI